MLTSNAFEVNIFLSQGTGKDKGGHLKIVAQTAVELLDYLNDPRTREIMGKVELLHMPMTAGGNPIAQQTVQQAVQQQVVQAKVDFASCAHVRTFDISGVSGRGPWAGKKCKDCGAVNFGKGWEASKK